MKSIMFTHNDLDGVGCGILHKALNGGMAEVNHCGNHTVDIMVTEAIRRIRRNGSERPRLIITDLGINEKTAKLVDEYEGEKLLLDHHATNRWLDERYHWAIVDERYCGTKLYFNYFDRTSYRFKEFVAHVDDFDRWIHKLSKSKDLNRLLYIYGIERFEERFLIDGEVDFSSAERLLLDIEEETIVEYTQKVERNLEVTTIDGGIRVGVAYADRFQSEVGNELLIRKDLDVVVLVDIGSRRMSIRSVPNFDVSEIAKRLGGGGHKNASGVAIKKNPNVSYYRGMEIIGDKITYLTNAITEKIASTHEDIETEQISKLFMGAEK